MTKLCLECTKRYYFNLYIFKLSRGSMPPDPPSWAWLRHAGTPLPKAKINLWTRPCISTKSDLLTVSLLIPCLVNQHLVAGRYKRRDVARVRLPSTRNPEEFPAGALPNLGPFVQISPSEAAVSTKTSPSIHMTACSRRNRSRGGGDFLTALEMSHSSSM